MLILGDCLKELPRLPAASVNLIYLDPPFFTQTNPTLRDRRGKAYQFKDKWPNKEAYLAYLAERLALMPRLLSAEGSIFLHTSSEMGANLKLVMDQIWGRENFQGEIIWYYRRWSNQQKGLIPHHQNIYFYSKTANFKFHPIYTDYSATTNIDQILQERAKNKFGKTVYKRDARGEVISARPKKGVPLGDVWEIPFLNPKAKERVGYPTQKPIELLERIIKISTDPGDMVLDPFCGSGTTLVSAQLLQRRFIGIDLKRDALRLAERRLATPYKTTSRLLQQGRGAYCTKTEAELAFLKQFDCTIVQRNQGIDAILKKHYANAPVALKIQREGEDLATAIRLLDNAGKKRHCSYTVLITPTPNRKTKRPSNMILLSPLNAQLADQLPLD